MITARQAYFAALLVCLTVNTALGQKVLQQPLTLVPADSVLFFDADAANLEATALAADATLRPRPYPEISRREARRTLRKGGWRADRNGDIYRAVGDINRLTPLLRWCGHGDIATDISALLYHRVLPAAQAEGFARHMAAQALISAGGMAYMTGDGHVYVNLLANSMARIRTKDLRLTLDQITNLPYGTSVRFRMGGIPTQTPVTLHIRLPEGQTALPTIFVNGRSEACPLQDGYIVVSRRWNT
ncbi:MAG: glycoside hydrolase family 127 protein, partial [Alloprevotella sp.]|nr:glycoside hydrolase family 127 protein [Alloprevotella sp.]